MSWSRHTFTIRTSSDKQTVTLHSLVIYPFVIHRRVKEGRGGRWVVDNARQTRGYVITHLLTGASVAQSRTWSYRGEREVLTMVQARHRAIEVAKELTVYPEFLLSDVELVQSGPNKNSIRSLVKTLWD
jgi:hypothetical protein